MTARPMTVTRHDRTLLTAGGVLPPECRPPGCRCWPTARPGRVWLYLIHDPGCPVDDVWEDDR